MPQASCSVVFYFLWVSVKVCNRNAMGISFYCAPVRAVLCMRHLRHWCKQCTSYQGWGTIGWVPELLLLLGEENQCGVLRSIQI